jgi:dienelactone hydrolase
VSAVLAAAALLLGSLGAAPAARAESPPETVRFASADGTTMLVGYLFVPAGAGSHPALVLLHGRTGAYSPRARGTYDATTLGRRQVAWARFWQARGHVALIVDSFGPRGHPAGFARGTYRTRPISVSEQTARPLDAYGALAYLRSRPNVAGDRVGLQGWSNGAMATLVAMSDTAPGIARPAPAAGFRAAVALYPGCGMEHVRDRWMPYAPVLMLLASADTDVSPARCESLAARTRAAGGPLEVVLYEGAEHAFDDPSPSRQQREPNRRATADAMSRAERFFESHLAPQR